MASLFIQRAINLECNVEQQPEFRRSSIVAGSAERSGFGSATSSCLSN